MTARRNIEDLYGLSPLQAGMLFHSVSGDGDDVYLRQVTCTLRGELDTDAFRRAWQAVVDRHGALRTAFFWRGLDRPIQAVQRSVELPFETEDWRVVPGAELDDRWRERIEAELRQGLDLSRAPLARVLLVRIGEREHRLLWTYHHLVLDGWSIGVIVRELPEVYRAEREGRPPRLGPAARFRDHVEWLESRDTMGEEAFWRRELADPPRPAICPPGREPVAGTDPEPRACQAGLSAAATRALEGLGRRNGLTQSTLSHAAWGLLLARHAATEDVIFGTVSSGRAAEVPGIAEMVGALIRTFPVRLRIDSRRPLLPWLGEVQETLVAAESFAAASLRDLQDWSGAGAGAELFTTLVAFENYRGPDDEEPAALDVGELVLSDVRASSRTNYPLSAAVSPGERLGWKLLFDGSRYDGTVVARLVRQIVTMLEAMPRFADRPVGDLPMMEPAERHQMLREWGGHDGADPGPASLVERFLRQAGRRPAAVAVQWGDCSLSYSELDARSHGLALELRRLGVDRGAPVGLFLERGADMVVAVLGIVRAGGYYLPLDTGYPQSRLEAMLEDSGARVVVTTGDLRGEVEAWGRRPVPVEEVAAVPGGGPGPTYAADLAYVIYTSGSTGRPKGVAICHRSVARLVIDSDYVDLGPEGRVGQAASASFDAATFEIWGPLLNGGCLIGLPREDTLSLRSFERRLACDRVQVLFLTTALFNQVANGDPEALSGLEHLLVGGEAMDASSVRRVLAHGGPTRLLNVYGPTECTTFATTHPVAEVPEKAQTLPIGAPISRTRTHVLGPALEPLPPMAVGELYLGGDGLAPGYLRRPAITARKFVPDPRADRPGQRLYRTGDQVRWNPAGALEFVGRTDHQVKLRGFRVELGEVEVALLAHPEVAACAVLVREASPDDRHLVAYVACPGQGPEVSRDFAAFLRRDLPEFMVPTRFVVLEALPLNANGKLDRAALSDPAPPEERAGAARSAGGDASGSPVEELLTGIFAEVIGAETVRPEDEFFDLGGNSLHAIQVISRVEKLLGVELGIAELFAAPRLADLAALVKHRLEAGAIGAGTAIVRVSRAEPQPLSSEQTRLWLFERLMPGTHAYHVPSALSLRGRLRFHALEQTADELARRHEALRTRFLEVDGEPMQEIVPPKRSALPLVDLSGLVPEEAESETRRLAQEDVFRPFDLHAGRPVRLHLIRRSETDAVLFFTLHHIVTDAWSMGVLVCDLGHVYPALLAGEPNPMEPLPFQSLDYAVWQRGVLADPAVEREIEYWRGRLGHGWPRLRLPYNRPRDPRPRFRGEVHRVTLPADLSAGLLRLGRREGVTLFMTIFALYLALLHRYTGQHDLCVGTSLAGRDRREWEGMVGFVVATLPLRTDLSGNPSFRELLRRVREVTLGAFRHREVPLETVVEELGLERHEGPMSLFQAFTVMHNTRVDSIELPDLALRPLEAAAPRSKFDLTLRVVEGEENVRLLFQYNRDLFDPETIAGMCNVFEEMARSVVQDVETPLSWLAAHQDPATDLLDAFNDDLGQAV